MYDDLNLFSDVEYLGQHMRFWYVSRRRVVYAQMSLYKCADLPEPTLHIHVQYE